MKYRKKKRKNERKRKRETERSKERKKKKEKEVLMILHERCFRNYVYNVTARMNNYGCTSIVQPKMMTKYRTPHVTGSRHSV